MLRRGAHTRARPHTRRYYWNRTDAGLVSYVGAQCTAPRFQAGSYFFEQSPFWFSTSTPGMPLAATAVLSIGSGAAGVALRFINEVSAHYKLVVDIGARTQSLQLLTGGGGVAVLDSAALPAEVVAGGLFNLSFAVSSTGVAGGVGVGSNWDAAAVSSASATLQVGGAALNSAGSNVVFKSFTLTTACDGGESCAAAAYVRDAHMHLLFGPPFDICNPVCVT